jgi:hypothetical protein
MKTIRRLYFYAVAFISLEVVLWGLIGLLRSIVSNVITDSAQALAQALSLILVGVPIFLVHWLWTQRAAAGDEEEKIASLRAVFFYLALMSTLVPVVQNLLALINRTFITALSLGAERSLLGGSQTWQDNILAIVMNGVVAFYIWNILRNEWASLPEKQNFAEVRRVYRFLWVLYSLIMVIFGAQQVLTFIFRVPSSLLGDLGRETFINGTALLLVGTPIWMYTWRICQDALADPAEKESTLRLGLLYLLALSGVIVVLTAGGNLLFMILNRIFGEAMGWPDFIQQIGGPLSIGLPFVIVWAYYGNWLNRQMDFEESLPRRAGMKRLYFYILSAVGLTAAFTGVALLFSFIIGILTGAHYIGEYGQLRQLTGSISTITAGLPLWLLTWRPMQAEALVEGAVGDHARRSVIRKTYLYIVLFASVIGGMVSAGTLIYNLINAALGGSTDGSFASNVLNALQLLILFAVLLVYHLSALRSDAAAKSDALDAKHEQFNVLVFDPGNGKFGGLMKATVQKFAPKLPFNVINVSGKIDSDLKASAVVLPGSLAMNTPESLEAWLRGFNGSRLVVPDEAGDVYWMTNPTEAARSLGQMAEGQEIQKIKKTGPGAWVIVMYIFAGLFALQLLFMLLAFGISAITNF